MKKIVWIIAGVVVLLVIVLLSARSGGSRNKARIYEEEAQRRSITEIVKASGEINPLVKVNISAHVIGKIERIYVKEGEDVKAGQPFLDLERQAFQAVHDNTAAQLAMSQTEERQAEVALADADVKLARARKLSSQGISSPEQLEAAELQHTSAELRLRQSREAVTQARSSLVKAADDLHKTTIYSPLAGRVIALNAKEGEVVVSGTMNNPASVIGTIADLSEILTEVDVDETEVVNVQTGQLAKIEVDAVPDHPYHGRVVEIGSSGYNRAQQPDVTFFRVKLQLEDPDARLRPGMSARAEISVRTQADAVVVPIQAVVERPPLAAGTKRAKGAATPASDPATATPATATATGEKQDEVPTVFVIEAGKAHQRAVETGISDATHVEIISGLSPGAKVVTGPYRSLKNLKDGDPVRVVKKEEEEQKAKQESEGSTVD